MAMQQHKIDQSIQLIFGKTKTKQNVTVIAHCISDTACGESYVLWDRQHQGYVGADGAKRMAAVEAMDDQHRGHGHFKLMWPEVASKTASVQKTAMKLNSWIIKEVSKAEGQKAGADGRAPLFASDASAADHTNRSTTDNIHLCEDAVNQDGVVVKLKACMDNGPVGAMCLNTRNVAFALPSNAVLRVFFLGDELVEMPADMRE